MTRPCLKAAAHRVINPATGERCFAAVWLTIEVQSGEVSAGSWQRAHGELLTAAAVTNGARDWKWHAPRRGVKLELRRGVITGAEVP